MVCYQLSKLVIMIIMYLDNYDYKNHDDLIIVTKNNHDNIISIFNDNCPTLTHTYTHTHDTHTAWHTHTCKEICKHATYISSSHSQYTNSSFHSPSHCKAPLFSLWQQIHHIIQFMTQFHLIILLTCQKMSVHPGYVVKKELMDWVFKATGNMTAGNLKFTDSNSCRFKLIAHLLCMFTLQIKLFLNTLEAK